MSSIGRATHAQGQEVAGAGAIEQQRQKSISSYLVVCKRAGWLAGRQEPGVVYEILIGFQSLVLRRIARLAAHKASIS